MTNTTTNLQFHKPNSLTEKSTAQSFHLCAQPSALLSATVSTTCLRLGKPTSLHQSQAQLGISHGTQARAPCSTRLDSIFHWKLQLDNHESEYDHSHNSGSFHSR
ncbi:hypothetical protein M0R45_026647 [Rubus argutus]|uniref:Uncharacterized protein n=1 Tax=Rubus argutus TaxID=59490 RepID=A0AAW1X1M6_RUBAR